MTRGSWSSRIGFIFAAAGSAVGLANIWRFPYIVGHHGGAAFVLIYLLCLIAIGFPVFIAEVLIGRTTQKSPSQAFALLGKSKLWGLFGKITILTGFIVSAFYGAVAAWIIGYLVEAFKGNLSTFTSPEGVNALHTSLMDNPYWGEGYHFVFMFLCFFVLYSGVRGGIERGNKVIMPILYLVLICLVIWGVSLPGSFDGIRFLFSPDWAEITPLAFLVALGQSFFTISIGQGTMVTYGSYLSKKDAIVSSCVPVVIMDTVVSLFSAIAVFTIVFSVGMQPDAGPGLIFQTLPLVFSKIPGGYFLAILFFLLVFMAALTSQISAMEPSIAFLIDRFRWKRSSAVLMVSLAVYLVGIPCALSSSILKETQLFGMNPLDLLLFAASSILIPIGGFFAVALVGWRWGIRPAMEALHRGAVGKHPWLDTYFWFCFKYLAPVLIIVVFLNALGVI